MGIMISGEKASARCGAVTRGAGVVRGTGRGRKGGKKRRTARLLHAHGPDDSSNSTCKKRMDVGEYERFGEGCRDAVEPNNVLRAKIRMKTFESIFGLELVLLLLGFMAE